MQSSICSQSGSAGTTPALVMSLVHTRLDYGIFVLVGLPVYLQRHLQSVLNAAARLVFRLRRYDHVTDALATLHCVYHNVLTSRWLLWRFGCYMVSHHHTSTSWFVSLTCPVVADFGQHHHTNCSCHHSS